MKKYVTNHDHKYCVTAEPMRYGDYLAHRNCPPPPKYLAWRKGYLVVDDLIVLRGAAYKNTDQYEGWVEWWTKSDFEACWQPE